MERCWVSLLLLGSVSANVFLRDTPPLSYNKAQVAVVKQFNIEATPPNLYRLVSADPVPKWNPTSSDFQSFPLKIKETVCHGDPEKIKVDKCAFKANGITQTCTAGYQYKGGNPPKAQTFILCKKVK
ncbi:lutzicidin [Anolis carolinensis]|uniref:Vipericidin n=1 Tax=Anolis carolinensis TaxID=28377 RepID=A0A077MEJ0_ANOCA|nr:PREDICTED: cathelicidin-related peptide lutzicidin [Anolis carolinensis]CCI87998.1 AcCATH-3 [Anolis carolinensis]|eukprot:XP_008116757.1 PREDICTED: cathelicidin-related peptide lutzicidin [Anolis carolinensis]